MLKFWVVGTFSYRYFHDSAKGGEHWPVKVTVLVDQKFEADSQESAKKMFNDIWYHYCIAHGNKLKFGISIELISLESISIGQTNPENL